MMNKGRLILGVMLVCAAVNPVVAGPYEDGRRAYFSGDYATALRLFRSLADQGDADSQFAVGVVYKEGKGVPQDLVQAYMWIELSASRQVDAEKKENAVRNRFILVRKMTPAQIAEAQRLVRDWKPKQ